MSDLTLLYFPLNTQGIISARFIGSIVQENGEGTCRDTIDRWLSDLTRMRERWSRGDLAIGQRGVQGSSHSFPVACLALLTVQTRTRGLNWRPFMGSLQSQLTKVPYGIY
jgi:hypothetical protein